MDVIGIFINAYYVLWNGSLLQGFGEGECVCVNHDTVGSIFILPEASIQLSNTTVLMINYSIDDKKKNPTISNYSTTIVS